MLFNALVQGSFRISSGNGLMTSLWADMGERAAVDSFTIYASTWAHLQVKA